MYKILKKGLIYLKKRKIKLVRYNDRPVPKGVLGYHDRVSNVVYVMRRPPHGCKPSCIFLHELGHVIDFSPGKQFFRLKKRTTEELEQAAQDEALKFIKDNGGGFREEAEFLVSLMQL